MITGVVAGPVAGVVAGVFDTTGAGGVGLAEPVGGVGVDATTGVEAEAVVGALEGTRVAAGAVAAGDDVAAAGGAETTGVAAVTGRVACAVPATGAFKRRRWPG